MTTGSPSSRSTRTKIAIFRECFTGLLHVYGTYDPRTGRACQVKDAVTDRVIFRHLKGEKPYGVYLLVKDRIRALSVDFDEDDTSAPALLVEALATLGVQAYVERSKSKGYHVWIFFEHRGVLAAPARRMVYRALTEIGEPKTEVFPKQDALAGETAYGNFINAPLFGRLVPRGRTVFVDMANDWRPYPDQWSLLANVERIPERLLNRIVGASRTEGARAEGKNSSPTPGRCTESCTYGLPPCAQRMLDHGVEQYQRVACFRLAIHLKKAGLPQDLAICTLKAWAGKNRPRTGKGIVTEAEIMEQTEHAFAKRYRGCGCEDPAVAPYCVPDCPLRSSEEA